MGEKRSIPEKARDVARLGGVKEYTALSKFRSAGTEGRKKKPTEQEYGGRDRVKSQSFWKGLRFC